MFGVAEWMRLELLVIGQHVLERPSGCAACDPIAEVVSLATHVNEGVDRSAAALHFTARTVDRPTAERGFGLRVIHPVAIAVVVGMQEADGNLETQ